MKRKRKARRPRELKTGPTFKRAFIRDNGYAGVLFMGLTPKDARRLHRWLSQFLAWAEQEGRK
jgi:hypothetical protein